VQAQVAARPFPWRCLRCRKNAVWPASLAYSSQIQLEGQVHTVDTPNLEVPRCRECGELHFDNSAEEQISRAARAQLNLLQPEQIQTNRIALGLSVTEFAARLGVPEDLLRDWERGFMFQPRAADNLMRAFFALPEVRAALSGVGQSPSFGALVGSTK
jgi:DNA-binding transcriptional regulator YiaG